LPFQGDYHEKDHVHPPDGCGHQDAGVPQNPHEEQKKWYDLDDNRKKQLEVHIYFFSFILVFPSGGPRNHDVCPTRLEAGSRQVSPFSAVATTPGTNTRRRKPKKRWVIFSYLPTHRIIIFLTRLSFFLKSLLTFTPLARKKKRDLTLGVQDWHKDSYSRTEEFRNHGPRAPTTWVLVDGRDKIPKSALEVGRDKDGHPIYIARAYYENSLRTFFFFLGGGWLPCN
jgi:hypothetical protein